jgi:predicted nucleic acid-binding Zn ribbon protein
MPAYNFRCPLGHSKELSCPFGLRPKTIRCKCGKPMTYTIAYPRVQFRGPGFTTGGYDYMEEARTGRNFMEEKEIEKYEKNKDDLDVELEHMGIHPFKPITRQAK